MDKHLIVLGALFLGLGIMGLIGMTVVFVIFSIGSAALGTAAVQEGDIPAFLSALPIGLGLFICLMIAVGTVPSLIAGIGLLQKRRWARVWALVAGILNLPGFPIGTCVGIYAIWVFLQDETESALTP
jgi:hypothetical protein